MATHKRKTTFRQELDEFTKKHHGMVVVELKHGPGVFTDQDSLDLFALWCASLSLHKHFCLFCDRQWKAIADGLPPAGFCVVSGNGLKHSRGDKVIVNAICCDCMDQGRATIENVIGKYKEMWPGLDVMTSQ